jgi:octaprenyl-diphosphate synthase
MAIHVPDGSGSRICIDDLLETYDEYLTACRAQLVRRLEGEARVPALVAHLERGKMLRALLVYVAGFAVGGTADVLAPGAEAIELLHAASLVHDDIIDSADRRRGQPALHTQVGGGSAIVIGDYLLVRAFAVLGGARASLTSERLLSAVSALALHAGECCLGEFVELSASPETSEEEYFSIVQRKTASQFAAAASVGVILGGGTTAQIDAARRYGTAVGVAYQIRDDVLDIVGDAVALGKPVGNSMLHRRPMLPLIYLREGGFEVGEIGRQQLLALLRERGIFHRVESEQERNTQVALAALGSLPHSRCVDELSALAQIAGTRTT